MLLLVLSCCIWTPWSFKKLDHKYTHKTPFHHKRLDGKVPFEAYVDGQTTIIIFWQTLQNGRRRALVNGVQSCTERLLLVLCLSEEIMHVSGLAIKPYSFNIRQGYFLSKCLHLLVKKTCFWRFFAERGGLACAFLG